MRKYHYVVNGYLDDCVKQMQEQAGFAEEYLSELEEGEAVILCQDAQTIKDLGCRHSREAVLLTAENYEPEAFLKELADWMEPSDLYLFGSDYSGGELCVRAAARAGGSSAVSVHGLEAAAESEIETAAQYAAESGGLTVRKMVYSNHMEAAFVMERGPFCISLAKGAERQSLTGEEFEVRRVIPCASESGHIESREFIPETEEKGLEDAKVIIAAGRGAKKKENMQIAERLAEALGGEVGVSRPAAMNAWEPMNRLIGVSGAMVSPDVCITAGVSGAAAFYAGIEKSKHIVAVNTDENAPIMKMADVAVADDWMPVLEALEMIRKE